MRAFIFAILFGVILASDLLPRSGSPPRPRGQSRRERSPDSQSNTSQRNVRARLSSASSSSKGTNSGSTSSESSGERPSWVHSSSSASSASESKARIKARAGGPAYVILKTPKGTHREYIQGPGPNKLSNKVRIASSRQWVKGGIQHIKPWTETPQLSILESKGKHQKMGMTTEVDSQEVASQIVKQVSRPSMPTKTIESAKARPNQEARLEKNKGQHAGDEYENLMGIMEDGPARVFGEARMG